ncbi:MAG: T9SS type A sorting domain-containing protein [Bacteroidia bacterium]|nr:T9SS type A sorting domain-containing protein [Bacteroidia bacterium]
MKNLTLFLLLAGIGLRSVAANYFWVGGSGNWSDFANHWATSTGGGIFYSSVPGSNDNVFFDGNSFSGTGQAVTADVDTYCKDMDWTGATFHPTLKPDLATPNVKMHFFGSITLIADMFLNLNDPNTQEIWLEGSGNHTLTFSNHALTAQGGSTTDVIINGTGTYMLMDTLRTANLYVSKGTFNTNNQFLDLKDFMSYNSFPRTLNLGSSTIRINSGTVEIDAGGLNFNQGTSTFDLWNSTFRGGGLTFYTLKMNSWPNSNCQIYDQNTFRNLYDNSYDLRVFQNQTVTDTFELSYAGGTVSLSPGIVFTGLGEFIVNGSCAGNKTLRAFPPTGTAAIARPNGTINVNFVNLENVTAQGGATFNANSCTPLGTTTGWNIVQNGGVTYYWIGGNGIWQDSTKWGYMNCRDEPAYCLPTLNDNVYFGECSFLLAGQALEIKGHATCHDMTWANVHNMPTFKGWGDLYISGSMILDTAMQTDFSDVATMEFHFVSGDTEIIDLKGHRLGEPTGDVPVVFNGNGSWRLLDSLYCSEIDLASGGLFTQGHPIHSIRFGSGIPNPRTLDLSTSMVRLETEFYLDGPNLTFQGDSTTLIFKKWHSSMIQTDGFPVNKIIMRGGESTLWGYGSVIDTFRVDDTLKLKLATDVTFGEQADFAGPGLEIDFKGKTLQLPGEIIFSGSPSSLVRLYSDPLGLVGGVNRAQDSLCFEYLEIERVNATGGAFWGAGWGCVDLGGNSGWFFSPTSVCSALVSAEGRPESEGLMKVWPNPLFQGETLQIEVPEPGSGMATVLDLRGQTILQSRIAGGKSSISTEGLAAGSYLLKLTWNNTTRVARILVK